MEPFPRQMVSDVAAGSSLGARYSNYSNRQEQTRRPEPLRAWLDQTLPEQIGVPRSYGLYTSTVLEIVTNKYYPGEPAAPRRAPRSLV